MSERVFTIRAVGHPNISATHRTTMELTKDDYVTKRGDCIVGISSSAACADLPEWLRQHLTSGGGVVIELRVGDFTFSFQAQGDPRLTLRSERNIVIRRSDYVDDRTLAVRAEAAARDVPREMVALLRRGERLVVNIRPVQASEEALGRRV